MALRSGVARNLIVTIGQSLNSAPDASGPQSYMGQIRDHYAGRARTEKGHVPGVAWLQWKRTQDWFNYFNYWAARAERVIFSMNGGQTDYGQLGNRTGAQCYADQTTISTNLRAYGPQVRIIGATTTPDAGTGVRTTTTGVQDVSTFAGAGVLNVASTTSPYVALATGTLKVATSGGQATINYTGSTSTTFTGCTTTAGSGTTSNGGYCRQHYDQNRLDGNALVLADANSAFDRTVDLANVPNMTDPSNTTYYADGTHPTALGQTLMFAAVQPVIDTLLL